MRFALPVGLVWDGDQIVLDPDQEVRGAVRMVFDLFARESTAFGVGNSTSLRFPCRHGGAWDGKLIWGRLTHSRVLGVLANPSYAGLYVFGRYQSSKEVEPSGEIRSRSRLMPQDAWRIVIPDHHEGYISADQFVVSRGVWRPIAPIAKGSPVPCAKAFASCRVCSSTAFAVAVSASAIPAMAASTRFINVCGSTARLWHPALASVSRQRRSIRPSRIAWSAPSRR